MGKGWRKRTLVYYLEELGSAQVEIASVVEAPVEVREVENRATNFKTAICESVLWL